MLHARMSLIASGVFLQGNPDGRIQVEVRGSRSVQVDIERPELHGQERAAGSDAIVTARCSLEPSPRVMDGFAALAEGRLPEGTPASALPNWRRYQEADGRLKTDTLLPKSGLPEGMRSLIDQVRADLYESARRATFVLRWKHALAGPHNPFRSHGLGAEWSLDGSAWYLLPGDTGLRGEPVPYVYPFPEVQHELQALLDAGADEPIAHQLFREAWDNRFRNRRSALVIGVAALEVGVKAFLARLVPSSEWLVINLPTPPIKRILSEYLPSLQLPDGVEGPAKSPPRRLLELVDKAVGTRNRIAHATGEDIDYDRLEGMLLGIREVLWILDYYSGSRWAVDHLGEQTAEEFGLTSESSP
jgi:hypothetical protein